MTNLYPTTQVLFYKSTFNFKKVEINGYTTDEFIKNEFKKLNINLENAFFWVRVVINGEEVSRKKYDVKSNLLNKI
jgi:hypothetical protein